MRAQMGWQQVNLTGATTTVVVNFPEGPFTKIPRICVGLAGFEGENGTSIKLINAALGKDVFQTNIEVDAKSTIKWVRFNWIAVGD